MTKLLKILILGFGAMLIAAFPLMGAMNSESMDQTNQTMDTTNQNDLVDVAASQDEFATFVMLLNKTGLGGVLKGEGPFTIFVPTDEAFEALGHAKLESLLMPSNSEELKSLLMFLVVPKKLSSSDIKGDMKVQTLDGKDLNITAEDGKITVEDAAVVGSDLDASNGVIHVIDKVIMPPKTN